MSATVSSQDSSRAADPPTEPRVAERPDWTVPSHERGDVVVLEPHGQLDRVGVERVRQAALGLSDRAVVIDLSHCVLTDPNALADIADDGSDPGGVCFVSRRLTCRLLLARTGIASRFAVFAQLEQALQARASASAQLGWGVRQRP